MRAKTLRSKRTWKLVRDLENGEHAVHTGCWQKEVEPGKFVVLPTKTAKVDYRCRFIHFGNHSFVPGQGEVIFGLNDIVEV